MPLKAYVGVPAETFARLVLFAISEPEDVGLDEILFRPKNSDGKQRSKGGRASPLPP